MGQNPNVETISRPSSRTGKGFETGDRHRAVMNADPEASAMPGPDAPGVAAVSSPFHSAPAPADESVPRRNPKLTLGVIGGLIAIIALVVAMLFSNTSFVDESHVPSSETTQVDS